MKTSNENTPIFNKMIQKTNENTQIFKALKTE